MKQLGSALKVLKSCRAVQPQDSGCLYDLGRTYERLGKVSEARAAYQLLVDTFPGSVPAIDARDRLER